jgi:hypothetical protein
MHTSEQQACPARASGQQRALAVNQRRVSAKAHDAAIGRLKHEQTLCTKARKQTAEKGVLCSLGLLIWARFHSVGFPSHKLVQTPCSRSQL